MGSHQRDCFLDPRLGEHSGLLPNTVFLCPTCACGFTEINELVRVSYAPCYRVPAYGGYCFSCAVYWDYILECSHAEALLQMGFL